ncbi:MAG: DUF86 domain-containing protein [Candidatus Electrothrix aestuarii]|uniref:DUF86 domain-containing protein n=1 Tax=Candidatus Electrothrix aestuarii TaxID=3062594 RepID=A0AAU8LX12_9BACT|nr:DUF86 domain-containing protein [Candidatus Electrothrix aestuarii]
MSERTGSDFLSHIREALQRITAYTETMSSSDFFEDIKTQDAVSRNLEIIGEATKNLAGMRDRLIHQYFGVNLDIVWDVAKKELPQLLLHIRNIEKVLQDEDKKGK